MSEGNDKLGVVRCRCGGFVGYATPIKDGEVYVLCRKCKAWVGFVGAKQGALTAEQMAKKIADASGR